MLEYIFSFEFWSTVLRMATPILFAAMAAIIGDQANVLCIGYEGIMLLSAMGGALASAYSQSLIVGLLGGLLAGALLSAFFAYFVLYQDTTPLLAGLAVNTLASGITIYSMYLLTGMKLNTSTLPSKQFPSVDIPIIKDIPFLGPFLSGHNLMVYISFLATYVVWFLLFRTKLGLRIRAVGKDPNAAASMGIDVKKTKFIALIISGLLASFGGMYMSMGYMKYFSADMIAGRGFLGIAAQRLGASNPVFVLIVTIIFGAATAFGITAQTLPSVNLPAQFASMTPYLATLIGLAIMGEINISRQKKRNEEIRRKAMENNSGQ